MYEDFGFTIIINKPFLTGIFYVDSAVQSRSRYKDSSEVASHIIDSIIT